MGKYIAVYIALLVLTVATYAAAHVNFGQFNLVIALAIATTKATLVALFFMHLYGTHNLYKIVLVCSVLFVLLLAGFATADAHLRFELARPNAPVAGLPGEFLPLQNLPPEPAGHEAP